jgi:predicted patatin/cPLA2 family phospholipase
MPARHPVLELLAARAAGRDGDGARLALALEGGGMRGVVSAGMASAIERLGLTDCFDLVVGTSAGAINGAALLAGVSGASCTAYHAAMTTRAFINPYRLLLGRAAVDVAFALDHAGDGLDAGRHERTVTSRIPLHCVAVDVASAEVDVLSELHSAEELRSALLATSRMPWVGGAPVEFRGRRYLDGGLAESIPHRTAIALGATHVLVLQTRPWGTGPLPASRWAERIITKRLERMNPGLLELYRRRPADYERAVGEIASATLEPAPSGPWIFGLRLPDDGPVVDRLERHPPVLEAAGRAAGEVADEVLSAVAVADERAR